MHIDLGHWSYPRADIGHHGNTTRTIPMPQPSWLISNTVCDEGKFNDQPPTRPLTHYHRSSYDLSGVPVDTPILITRTSATLQHQPQRSCPIRWTKRRRPKHVTLTEVPARDTAATHADRRAANHSLTPATTGLPYQMDLLRSQVGRLSRRFCQELEVLQRHILCQ